MGNTASKDNPADNCPALNKNNASSCPVPEEQRSAVYNVYNQRIDSGAAASTSSPRTGYIDPRNNMPTEPHQQPCAGQRHLISTNRLVSNIPKGGTAGTWVYPSPQMFYNCESATYLLALTTCCCQMQYSMQNCLGTSPASKLFYISFRRDLYICSSEAERQGQ